MGSAKSQPVDSVETSDCSTFVTLQKKTKRGYKLLHGLQRRRGHLYPMISKNRFSEDEICVPAGYRKISTDAKLVKEYWCSQGASALQPSNEMYKKIKQKHKNAKVYFILDNGGHPFVVYVAKHSASVYRIDTEKYFFDDDETFEGKAWAYTKLVATFKAFKIWIGKSPKNEMTTFSGGHGPRFDGNSILLRVGETKYVSIGWEIYSFQTTNPIVKYVSPVGNNGVPYPYAIDSKNMYYLLIDQVKLEVPREYANDPYEYLYRHRPKDESAIKATMIQERVV